MQVRKLQRRECLQCNALPAAGRQLKQAGFDVNAFVQVSVMLVTTATVTDRPLADLNSCSADHAMSWFSRS